MVNLRELAESDLAISLEGDFGLPVELIDPDGVKYDSVNGQILYDQVRADPATLDLSPVDWPASPTPTPAPPVVPTPTPCALSPAEPFAAAYADENGEVAARLACPLAEATVTGAAFQPFERGLMFWRADRRDIDVLHTDGWWAGYDDTWDESQPVDDPSLTPPEGLLQPIRGFGKVWRGLLGGPQVEIGWALEAERSYEMTAQSFGGGWMFLGAEGEVFILYVGGTWESR